MAKPKIQYECSKCGSQSPKWTGQCSDCGSWNTLIEVAVAKQQAQRRSGYAGESSSQVIALNQVACVEQDKTSTGLHELDHVLGGGLVSGSVVLIGGDPGIGKSTLLVQAISNLSQNASTLYVTGEESLEQVSLRAQRLGLKVDAIDILAETEVERILSLAHKNKPKFLVIDSIQTMYSSALDSAPGGVGQIRESAAQLVQFAKQTGTILFLIGHVTKEGALAGPRVLEHMVDTVLYFEGQSDSRYRVIRAVKNRFGAVNELGVFAMTDKGLKEVSNPSAIFLSGYSQEVPGSVVMVTWEGSRPMLVEIQALVDESHLGNPRRVTVGLDQNRLAMLLAVLHRHGGVITHDQDVFVNAVGGVRVSETASDLASLLAVLSSLRNQPLGQGFVAFGEVGLGGEIRPVPNGQERLREAAKHGFKKAIVPEANKPRKAPEGLEVIAVNRLADAIQAIR